MYTRQKLLDDNSRVMRYNGWSGALAPGLLSSFFLQFQHFIFGVAALLKMSIDGELLRNIYIYIYGSGKKGKRSLRDTCVCVCPPPAPCDDRKSPNVGQQHTTSPAHNLKNVDWIPLWPSWTKRTEAIYSRRWHFGPSRVQDLGNISIVFPNSAARIFFVFLNICRGGNFNSIRRETFFDVCKNGIRHSAAVVFVIFA